MNKDKVTEYKGILEAKKVELVNRLEALMKDKTRQKGAISADSEEQAQDVENDEVVDHLEEIEMAQLRLVEVAITKIDNGRYGICDVCGEDISEARLKAVPQSHDCIKCADKN